MSTKNSDLVLTGSSEVTIYSGTLKSILSGTVMFNFSPRGRVEGGGIVGRVIILEIDGDRTVPVLSLTNVALNKFQEFFVKPLQLEKVDKETRVGSLDVTYVGEF